MAVPARVWEVGESRVCVEVVRAQTKAAGCVGQGGGGGNDYCLIDADNATCIVHVELRQLVCSCRDLD